MTDELERQADRLNGAFQALTANLRARFRVSASVAMADGLELRWCKVAGGWNLKVANSHGAGSGPLTSVSLTLRLEAVEKVPDLLEQLRWNASREEGEVRDAATKVEALNFLLVSEHPPEPTPDPGDGEPLREGPPLGEKTRASGW